MTVDIKEAFAKLDLDPIFFKTMNYASLLDCLVKWHSNVRQGDTTATILIGEVEISKARTGQKQTGGNIESHNICVPA
jgi:hypothetical protein